jgi:hypothetical protein
MPAAKSVEEELSRKQPTRKQPAKKEAAREAPIGKRPMTVSGHVMAPARSPRGAAPSATASRASTPRRDDPDRSSGGAAMAASRGRAGAGPERPWWHDADLGPLSDRDRKKLSAHVHREADSLRSFADGLWDPTTGNVSARGAGAGREPTVVTPVTKRTAAKKVANGNGKTPAKTQASR